LQQAAGAAVGAAGRIEEVVVIVIVVVIVVVDAAFGAMEDAPLWAVSSGTRPFGSRVREPSAAGTNIR